MTHIFVVITVLAYLASLGFYLRFLNTGKEFTGRLATALMFMGLAGALPGAADARKGHAHSAVP